MVRSLLVAAALVLTAVPAVAKEEKKAADGPSRDVDLTPVAVPVFVGGQVRNYIFVTVRVTAKDDPNAIRAVEPLLRDAVVRAAHATPFGKADNYNMVDEPRVIAVLSARFPAIVGPGKIKSVSIPKQQPKNVLRMPKRS